MPQLIYIDSASGLFPDNFNRVIPKAPVPEDIPKFLKILGNMCLLADSGFDPMVLDNLGPMSIRSLAWIIIFLNDSRLSLAVRDLFSERINDLRFAYNACKVFDNDRLEFAKNVQKISSNRIGSGKSIGDLFIRCYEIMLEDMNTISWSWSDIVALLPKDILDLVIYHDTKIYKDFRQFDEILKDIIIKIEGPENQTK